MAAYQLFDELLWKSIKLTLDSQYSHELIENSIKAETKCIQTKQNHAHLVYLWRLKVDFNMMLFIIIQCQSNFLIPVKIKLNQDEGYQNLSTCLLKQEANKRR